MVFFMDEVFRWRRQTSSWRGSIFSDYIFLLHIELICSFMSSDATWQYFTAKRSAGLLVFLMVALWLGVTFYIRGDLICYHQKLHGTHPMEPTTPLSVHVVNIKCWWTATQSLPSCHIYSSFSLRDSRKRAILGWAWSTRCFTKVVEKKAISVKVIQCSSNRMVDLCV